MGYSCVPLSHVQRQGITKLARIDGFLTFLNWMAALSEGKHGLNCYAVSGLTESTPPGLSHHHSCVFSLWLPLKIQIVCSTCFLQAMGRQEENKPIPRVTPLLSAEPKRKGNVPVIWLPCQLPQPNTVPWIWIKQSDMALSNILPCWNKKPIYILLFKIKIREFPMLPYPGQKQFRWCGRYINALLK